MPSSLYWLKDVASGIAGTFRITPHDPKYWQQYMTLSRRVGLKSDHDWDEARLQDVLRKSDVWQDVPAIGFTLVNAEFKGGDEEQRLDILYMRNDGALLPCELKIGGKSKDTHGQLIRYIADLSYQKLNLEWVKGQHSRFVDGITDAAAKRMHQQKFTDFLSANAIEDRFIRVLPQTGVLIDEDFPPQLVKAVRYLNGYCGFAIRLITIRCYVAQEWRADQDEQFMRLDFVDMQ